MILDRRKFLVGMLSAAVAAPAIVKATSLMKVKLIDIDPEAMEFLPYPLGGHPHGSGIDLAAIRELLLPGLRALEGQYRMVGPQWTEVFDKT